MRREPGRSSSLAARVASACLVPIVLIAIAAFSSGGPALANNVEGSDSSRPDGSQEPKEAVDFDHELDDYVPKKRHYNFYFTYKTVHAWWDAVALGIEDAQRQFLKKGVTVTYEYLAPELASAQDQTQRLLAAANVPYDVIGVDVADEAVISPVLDQLVDEGKKVMTFSSSDAAQDCKRIAYVGNTHNYEDGTLITEALCRKLGYSGKVAILVGSEGAPCHEDRARGAKNTIAKYPDMELVEVAYDQDSVELAQELTTQILDRHQDLAGMICCNMSNPVGAARATQACGRNVAIVGMDHDREALRYLKEGAIYCLGVQDCYSIGFDTLQTAVKIADGVQPGELYPETVYEITTIVYQNDAQAVMEVLYGDDE